MKVQKVNLLMPVRKYLPASLVYIKVNSMNQNTAQFCSSNFSYISWFYLLQFVVSERTLPITIYYNSRVRPT